MQNNGQDTMGDRWLSHHSASFLPLQLPTHLRSTYTPPLWLYMEYRRTATPSTWRQSEPPGASQGLYTALQRLTGDVMEASSILLYCQWLKLTLFTSLHHIDYNGDKSACACTIQIRHQIDTQWLCNIFTVRTGCHFYTVIYGNMQCATSFYTIICTQSPYEK